MSSTMGTRHACDLDFTLEAEGYTAIIDISDSSPNGHFSHTDIALVSDLDGHHNLGIKENGRRKHRRELITVIQRAFGALEWFYQQYGLYEPPFGHERSPGRFIAPFIERIRTSRQPPRPYRVTHQALHDYTELRELGYDPQADVEDVAQFLRDHQQCPELFTETGIGFEHRQSNGEGHMRSMREREG